jgi:hypothetical protein
VFTATLTSGIAPAGSISFYDGTALLGPGTLTAGVATYSTSSLAAGSHSITAVFAGNADYAAVTSAPVVEVIEDFTLGAASGGSTSVTVSPGGTADFTLAVSPPSGTTLASAVSFSVTGFPSGATSTFSPASVAAGSGASNVTLAVTVPSDSASLPSSRPFGRGGLPIALGLLIIPFADRARRASRRVFRFVAVGIAGAALTAAVSGCGGGGNGGGTNPPPQSYNLTVTATSGSLSHTTSLTLTVE